MHKIKVNDNYNFELDRKGEDVLVNNIICNADVVELSPLHYHVLNDKASYSAEVVDFDKATKTASIKINNNIYTISSKDQFDVLLDKMGMGNLTAAKVSEIKAPMPGLVLKIFAKEGDDIKKGDNLLILEAMKMENIIKAPSDVIIKGIKVKQGDKVEKGQILMAF